MSTPIVENFKALAFTFRDGKWSAKVKISGDCLPVTTRDLKQLQRLLTITVRQHQHEDRLNRSQVKIV